MADVEEVIHSQDGLRRGRFLLVFSGREFGPGDGHQRAAAPKSRSSQGCAGAVLGTSPILP
jgi:hypothetical protein